MPARLRMMASSALTRRVPSYNRTSGSHDSLRSLSTTNNWLATSLAISGPGGGVDVWRRDNGIEAVDLIEEYHPDLSS